MDVEILTVVVHKVEGEVEVGHTHGLSDEVKIPERASNSKTGPSRAPLTFSRNKYRVPWGPLLTENHLFFGKDWSFSYRCVARKLTQW